MKNTYPGFRKMNKWIPILCLDFDGVIHSYTSGWTDATTISDPPVPGAFEFIQKALNHYRVAVFSSRSKTEAGRAAMRTWMAHWSERAVWVDKIEWPDHKPSATLLIDDRAITFTGVWPSMEELRDFKPWNKK